MRDDVTLVEIAALLAVAQDHAFGQPPGAQLRATVLGQRLATAAGTDPTEHAITWWASTLRFLGCTGHAFDMAVVFGDEIELRARALRADFANPFEVMRLMVSHAGPGLSGVGRFRSVFSVLAGGRRAAELNFRAACEVADVFAVRLGLDEPVRAALAATFERWNGRGLPAGSKGVVIPRPMRIVQLAGELEVLARVEGIARALEIIKSRRGRAYDPDLADLVLAEAAGWWDGLEPVDSWDAALAVAPPSTPLSDAGAHEALLVLADFADLKSPWTAGHSRAVAALALAACGPTAQAAALLHDLGRVAVPNTIWDKPGALTRDERDRAEAHALVTDQLLRRVSYTATLAGAACGAHERVDGSGYHRRLGGAHLDDAQRIIAAADCYQAMTSDRPYRAAYAPEDAAVELRAMSAAGRLDGEAVERVLAAAGHRRVARPPLPAGLTAREAEVLRLLALGLTTRQVADRLVISTKTADHHVQHIYTKIGVSTRGAAALFAIERGILPARA
ncbi:HD domain-containing phosphohydrolase [Frankia sp. Cas3]|uniref:HD domain-containing phosphohydrolase n=1 Tax=Frankia sp. Cas3 TaxID=3073926 RepID=UPI002AD44290|nr:HD domain-containing phosphohydrolase [Frankia sp. Cas3]